jgi:hypothetical protein
MSPKEWQNKKEEYNFELTNVIHVSVIDFS